MSYIGKTPVVGNFQVCDAISVVNGQAAYTMQVGSANVLPESVNNMLVSLNGVIQKPNTAYTVSGSTITFASNLASGDVIDFIQIFGDVLNIGTPSDGAVTSTKLASNSVTTAKITDANVTGAKTNFVSTSSAAGLQIKGDGTTDGYLQLNCNQNTHGIKLKSPPHSASADYTLTFPNNDGDANQALTTNGSGVLTWADAGGANTPAFQAYMNGGQTIANTTHTKLEMDAEVFDTNSKYDVSNYRFTPTVAGTYWVWGKFRFDETNDIPSSIIAFYKNGSIISKSVAFQTNVTTKTLGITVTLDDNDYLEIFAYQNSGTTAPISGGSYPDQDTGTWGAYKIII